MRRGLLVFAVITLGCSGECDCDEPASPGPSWIDIPDGSFLMGRTEDLDLTDHSPEHQVSLSAYRIGLFEVTNTEYAVFLNTFGATGPTGPYLDLLAGHVRFDAETLTYFVEYGFERHPITGVSWYGADAYCRAVGMRLPTEAEWEMAARGQCTSFPLCTVAGPRYPWGDDSPACGLANYAADAADCVGDTSPVGWYTESASQMGVYDMSGNVYEWVADWYGSDYYDSSPTQDPPGPPIGDYKVLRGGSWAHSQEKLPTWERFSAAPSALGAPLGFRCAATLNSARRSSFLRRAANR